MTSAEASASYVCPMHPEVTSDSPGSCPKCGMDLVAQSEAGEHAYHGQHGRGNHGDHTEPAAEPTGSYTCPMHPEVTSDSPGSCPKCGMDLVPQADAGKHAHHGHHGHGNHGDHTEPAAEPTGPYTCPMHPEVTSDSPGSCPKCGMDLVAQGAHEGEHANHAGAEAKGGQMAQGSHAGHGPAPEIAGIEPHFMSMAALTEDKPASPDGLIMEWIEAPFGPFYPGLPGGLGLMLTLDGDSVTDAQITPFAAGTLAPGFPAAELPDKMAALAPLAPICMRELACRALEAAAHYTPSVAEAQARAAALERERVASHLVWLAGLFRQSGLVWPERRAVAMLAGLRHADAGELARRAPAIRAFVARVRGGLLLRDRLTHIGPIDEAAAHEIGGPVARSAGLNTDARDHDNAYADLDFQTLSRGGSDAWARLLQRLDEITQSLDLIEKAGTIAAPAASMPLPATGYGMARVETPRGPANLHLKLSGDAVESLHLTTPFAAMAASVGPLTSQTELAEALCAIGSLDLDPWGAAT